MKRATPPADDSGALPADYTSARFVSAVTFRGATMDGIGPSDPFTLTHTPAALVVRYLGSAARELPPQVRIVPWANVACAEPSPSFLPRYLEAIRAKPLAAFPPKR